MAVDSGPRRFWVHARAKVEREGVCRCCPETHGLQAAHVIGRAYDKPMSGDDREDLQVAGHELAPGVLYVHPGDVIPLCRRCHEAYDRRALEVLPRLSLDEQGRAAAHVGLVRALGRTAPVVLDRQPVA
jgi:hypothetical protein